METKTISLEILKENGYTEYNIETEEINRYFQKQLTDEKGVKYFINCNYLFFLNNGKQLRFWDFSIQIETEKGAVNIDTIQWFNQDGIYSQRTIKDVEDYFEKMWIANGSPYYKKYKEVSFSSPHLKRTKNI